jgi:hypothetical protein
MYDFIVVGGENLQLLYATLLDSTDGWYAAGPSGIAAATSLARSSKKITVLLEAGDSNSDPVLRVDGQRWLTFQNPEMNWGYKLFPRRNAMIVRSTILAAKGWEDQVQSISVFIPLDVAMIMMSGHGL